MASNGLFIVLEGIDGAGKTTIANMLIEYLRSRGYKTIYTYEPHDSLYVEILKTKYNELRDAYLDALTYAADRLIHLKTIIKPYLEKNYIVICDRYFYSSVAYQSAQGAPLDWVLEINRFALRPDIAIYLDVDPEIGLKRRSRLRSKFPEYEVLDFLVKVRKAYIELVKRGLLILVDAHHDVDTVFKDVVKIIEKNLTRIKPNS